ncbi:MAG: hypothetical protein CME63_13885 [Halobacteriovoraceae bacterium]|nr:hypothetical protein [Halobacteriovoraceae bacterium]|tara:strand:+ start:15082 stop:15882 length:801 start_codon:yes stop_codon:yes gene_type:complete
MLTKSALLLSVLVLLPYSNLSFAGQKAPNLNKVMVKTPRTQSAVKEVILSEFKKELSNKEVLNLKKQVLSYSGKAIPALIDVMKTGTYPDKNRWIATFLVGRIMGKKSSPFLAKFLKHPNWVLRMASLKTLLALKEKKYSSLYGKALKDNSFIVRKQALDNIRLLNAKDQAPYVWSMLYDKRNYYAPKDGTKKRTNLIKQAIRTVGELKFEKAKKPLLSMIQKKKYEDIFNAIDYSLTKITGKKSPEEHNLKMRFWKRIALSEVTL